MRRRNDGAGGWLQAGRAAMGCWMTVISLVVGAIIIWARWILITGAT